MAKQKLAVIGVGALGRHHARILSEMSDVQLVAVVDTRADQGQDVAQRCGARWLADYTELLQPGVVDAVSIVVPTVAHLRVAGDFLRAGIPVLVEKPLAATAPQARELAELARRHGTLLQVGHIERFNPAFQAARGQIDKPRYVRAERTSTFTFRSTDIGAVHDLMIHDIDLVLSLVNSPLASVEAFGMTVMGGHEDAVQARLRFQNGCIADLTASRIHPVATRALHTWSASGCVTCDLHQRQVTCFRPSEKLRSGPSPLDLVRQPGADLEALKKGVFGDFIQVETVDVPTTGPDALTSELREFVDCLQTGKAPQVGGPEGLAAMEVADAILESVAWHREHAGDAPVLRPHPAMRDAA